MGTLAYRIPELQADRWEALIRILTAHADRFRGYFPHDDLLGFGRLQFLSLAGAQISPWGGMRDSDIVELELSAAVRELLIRLETQHPPGTHPKLWAYDLLRQGRLFLRVEDFDLYLLAADELLEASLQSAGFNSGLWEIVDAPNLLGSAPIEIDDQRSADTLKRLGRMIADDLPRRTDDFE